MSARPPDLEAAGKATPERILQRLDWKVIRRLDGLLQGDYRSLFYGYGVDFADLREYQAEDDIRYIDWNVTARMDTAYVRQYVEDRDVTAWFLLDLSPSVDFGTTGVLKRTALVDFVTTVARLLTRHGNRVGAVFFGHGIEKTLPPRSGKIQVLRLTHELLKFEPASGGGMTDLGALLSGGLGAIRRRSLVFILSDFISSPGWEKALHLLTRKHEVLAIRIWDPMEMELPDLGLVRLEDAETGEQLVVDTRRETFRKQFHAGALRRAEALEATFKQLGVDSLPLSTRDDLVDELLKLAARRKYRRR
jgi:uncharacterized protein (DUF58 family)